ncbi:MAG: nuclear transport factor 2 family protein [Actinomycetota bacterium]
MNQNEELLRKMDEAQAKQDVEGMMAAFADDVVVHIGGRSHMAGDLKGKGELMESYGRFVQVMGDNAEFETHDLVAGDKHGFMLQSFKGNRNGDQIEIKGIGIFHFTNGKISEAWFIDEDPYSADPWYDRGAK